LKSTKKPSDITQKIAVLNKFFIGGIIINLFKLFK
jgi:hypothetical protein